MQAQRTAFNEATGYRTVITYLEGESKREWSCSQLNVVKAKAMFMRAMESRSVAITRTQIRRGL